MAKPMPVRAKEEKKVVPWRPFTEMARWERDMEDMFEDFFGRRLRPIMDERWWAPKMVSVASPAVDLYEEKDEIVAKVELPGMSKEDIQVDVADHHLTIKGEKKKEEEVKEKNYYRCERS